MSPNLQRFLPLILIAFLLLIVLPAIFKKHSATNGPTAGTLSTETIGAMNLVDRGEQAFRAAHGGYSARVADLIELEKPLAHDLGDGVVIALDVSADAKTYYAHVSSTALSLVRARTGARKLVSTCVVVKSGSGVGCPKPPTSSTSTSTTTTTTTSSSTTG